MLAHKRDYLTVYKHTSMYVGIDEIRWLPNVALRCDIGNVRGARSLQTLKACILHLPLLLSSCSYRGLGYLL